MKSAVSSPIYNEGVFDNRTLEQMANEILFVENPLPKEYPILTARRLRTIREREVVVAPDTVTKLLDGEYTADSYRKCRGG